MPLRPWYKVVTPRQDLREARPLDASEFAMHLDQVRLGKAPEDYTEPERFFRQDDEVTEGVSVYTLLRNWPAMTGWSTKAARDAFYASPQLPRLLNPEALRRTIADGVAQKLLAYVGPKGADAKYYPFVFGETLLPANIEFSDGMFLITGEEAAKQVEEPKLTRLEVTSPPAPLSRARATPSPCGATTSTGVPFR
jgi:hypothetical protein